MKNNKIRTNKSNFRKKRFSKAAVFSRYFIFVTEVKSDCFSDYYFKYDIY